MESSIRLNQDIVQKLLSALVSRLFGKCPASDLSLPTITGLLMIIAKAVVVVTALST